MYVRKKHSASFKAKVALASDKTMAELCSECECLGETVSTSRKQQVLRRRLWNCQF